MEQIAQNKDDRQARYPRLTALSMETVKGVRRG